MQHWPSKNGTSDQLWLVAKEAIPAGMELRYDYEDGGSRYWNGQSPHESDWRSVAIRPPPPSSLEPTIDFLPALLAGEPPMPWPVSH